MFLASAGFLTALVLLALPWWLHRRESASTTPQPVASLYLLREASEPRARRRVLRYRWLLLLRAALLSVLAIAFAQPVLERFISSDSAPAAVSRLVVVDVSASMTAVWDQARVQAEDLLTGRAALVGAGARLELLTQMTEDPAAHQAGLRDLAVSAESVSFDGLLGRLSSIADSLVEVGEPLEVHLISDFQASRAPERFNGLIAGATRPVVLHPLNSRSGNWFIESLNADNLIVRGLGTAAADLPVQIFADDELLLARDVTVAADGRTALPLPRIEAGRHDIRLTARLAVDDALSADNVGFYVIPQASEQRVTVLADVAAQQVYVDAALAAIGWESAGDDLSGYPVIALDPRAAAEALGNYLENGGRALVFSGNNARSARRLPVLENPVVASVAPSTGQRIRIADQNHPLLQALSGWEDVLVYQHLPVSEPGGRVLLRLDDGSPFLLERETGRGRVLVFTTSLAPDWTNLGAMPVFVNLVAVALEYLNEAMLPVEAIAGQRLMLPPGNTQIIAADGSRMLTLQQSQGLEPVSIATPGHFELRSTAGGQGRRYLAVNVSTLESALTSLPPAQLDRWQSALAGIDSASPVAQTVDGRFDLPLAPWLLLVLLLVALLEPIVANGIPFRAAPAGRAVR